MRNRIYVDAHWREDAGWYETGSYHDDAWMSYDGYSWSYYSPPSRMVGSDKTDSVVMTFHGGPRDGEVDDQ